jgi:hypothetical protein
VGCEKPALSRSYRPYRNENREASLTQQTLSSASLAFFDSTRKAGEVFRYIIFNRYGYSVLVSDHDQVTPVELSDFSAAARSVTKISRSLTQRTDSARHVHSARTGNAPHRQNRTTPTPI